MPVYVEADVSEVHQFEGCFAVLPVKVVRVYHICLLSISVHMHQSTDAINMMQGSSFMSTIQCDLEKHHSIKVKILFQERPLYQEIHVY